MHPHTGPLVLLLTLVAAYPAAAAPAGASAPKAPSSTAPSTPPETPLNDLIKERGGLAKPEMTTFQRDEAFRDFERGLYGRRVKLEVKVLDVKELPGGYYIQVQLPHMTRPMLLRTHREAALAAKKGQGLVVTATLRGLIGLGLEPDLDDLRYPDLPPPGGMPSASPLSMSSLWANSWMTTL